MPILYGAVAYREDLLRQFEGELASWDFARVNERPIACPRGGVCDKAYRLVLEADASDESAREYVGMVLKAMERQSCDRHPPFIRMNPPH